MAGSTHALNNRGLTIKQAAFVKAFTNKKKETFLNGTKSMQQAYGYESENVAAVEAHTSLRIPKINKSIRECLGLKVDLNLKVSDFLENCLKDAETNKEEKRHALQAVDLIAKLQGSYAPQEHLVGPLTKEERKESLKLVADAIREGREEGNKE